MGILLDISISKLIRSFLALKSEWFNVQSGFLWLRVANAHVWRWFRFLRAHRCLHIDFYSMWFIKNIPFFCPSFSENHSFVPKKEKIRKKFQKNRHFGFKSTFAAAGRGRKTDGTYACPRPSECHKLKSSGARVVRPFQLVWYGSSLEKADRCDPVCGPCFWTGVKLSLFGLRLKPIQNSWDRGSNAWVSIFVGLWLYFEFRTNASQGWVDDRHENKKFWFWFQLIRLANCTKHMSGRVPCNFAQCVPMFGYFVRTCMPAVAEYHVGQWSQLLLQYALNGWESQNERFDDLI